VPRIVSLGGTPGGENRVQLVGGKRCMEFRKKRKGVVGQGGDPGWGKEGKISKRPAPLRVISNNFKVPKIRGIHSKKHRR